MPSSALQNKILCKTFHPQKPLYNVQPKIFGCICFVHLYLGLQDKLSPKSLKCIFLGYYRTQKGYICYSPLMKKKFVATDVTFFEDYSYYYKQKTSHNEQDSLTVSLPVPVFNVPKSPQHFANPPYVYVRKAKIQYQRFADPYRFIKEKSTAIINYSYGQTSLEAAPGKTSISSSSCIQTRYNFNSVQLSRSHVTT